MMGLVPALTTMTAPGYILFDTSIGRCGLVWREALLLGVWLPGASGAALRARVRRDWPDADEAAPPASVQRTIERIRGLLQGGTDDLLDLELDLTGVPPFHQRVYAIARRIRPGATRTYGEIAAELGG